MKNELHIFDTRKRGKYFSAKSFLAKLVWRLLYKKIKLDDKVWMSGRCIDCDAGVGFKLSCSEFYCPCKFNEHLKLK